MATPPPLVLTRSRDQTEASLRHPVPDLQSLQGAYVGNIERLEEHAERMSEKGSDLGEEIRKLHTELKQSDSRRSSFMSNQPFEEPMRQFSTRSRGVSISSHANSIVDVNGTARWGGYSPAGYITSPVGSQGSNSWANPPPAPGQRQRSESKTSRLGQIVHPEEVEEARDVFPASPDSPRSAPFAGNRYESPPPTDRRVVSSFTRKYEEIAQQIQDGMDTTDQPYHEGSQYRAHHDPYDRPATAASTDTTQQARTLWHDFDGAHAPDTVPEEPEPSHGGGSRHSSFMRGLDMPSQGAPPPDENMVFYPAPVPRMLNLPKRLSQLPASDVQARRRTQIMESIQAENRKSAHMMGDVVDTSRKNRQSMANLPPALRASVYFDHQNGPSQEFAVKGESAKDTLDSILDASAHAPVSAFVDHPYAGHVGNEVYGQEDKRRNSKFPERPNLAETRRRSSFNVLDTKHGSNGAKLNKLKKRNSSADMNVLVVRASENRMSLGAELDEHDDYARGPPADETSGSKARYYAKSNSQHSGDEHSHHEGDDDERSHHEESDGDEPEEGGGEDEEVEEQLFGAPTTLLAELQMRKAKQKTRNMNYATMFEQGMLSQHRTLLQLDDEAEKEKQKRIRKKVQLAWEAQAEEDDSDDDVPLGILYKQNNQRESDWDRTSPSQQYLSVPTSTTPGAESEEDTGETLGERMRRLKEKQILDSALGSDPRKSTVSGDFATEMLSKFGVSDNNNNDEKDKDSAIPAPKPTPSPGADGEEEEETLGQRRARLQAEALARGDEPSTTRPSLPSNMSMADVLSANPMDSHNQARTMTDQALISHLPQGSLLHQNVLAEERRRTQRLNVNSRTSSYGMHDFLDPLVRSAPKVEQDEALAEKIRRYKDVMAGVGVGGSQQQQSQSMMYPGQMMQGQSQMMGLQQQQQQQQQMMMQQGMMYPGQMMQNGMPMNMMQNGMNMPMGMQMNMPMNMQMQMQMQMGMGMQPMMMAPPMPPQHREMIDRWMQDVRQ
ncbi:hypothetical protein P153DRAFT_337707 [Dothidotthia symphoricarpi CBS 119687]|uniref:Uncharacterized protein n=1 Tax=Dothidotthia symphoricarpi CBS 119687 TaxID=1392245 RepID=A0A6A6AF76_9PLEO|nr:uncharacterized protein P153DRAFT_337707 [Dothidotthia symphoricarpi CBS 119687]KAF2130206.1 hypothetical protein P153DRAFT_337707 [Dothidotthia symphoricarpi CBS 119687]